MNCPRLSSFDVATLYKFGMGYVAAFVARLAIAAAVEQLAAPVRFARVLFLVALARQGLALSLPRIVRPRAVGPSRGAIHALYARRSEIWPVAAALGAPVISP